MKIFISEYIIFYETFEFNLYEELNMSIMFFDYANFYESLCSLSNRFVFKSTYYPFDYGPKNVFLKKKQFAHNFFWRRKLLRRNYFFKLIPWYFMPRKWMKYYNWWGYLPNCYKFFQYGLFNELVRDFYVNHQEMVVFRSEYPKYDCSLIFNHSNQQFDRNLIWLFEHHREWRGFVFFRERPYRLEYLLYNLKWIEGSTELIILNPNCVYSSSGTVISYARKWVYWTYHFYNSDRSRPFIVYGFWSSDYFINGFQYRVISYRFEFFRDSIALLGPIIGSTEVIKMYLYFFFRMFFYYIFLFWMSIFFALIYNKKKNGKINFVGWTYA